MTEEAYRKAMAQRLAEKQREQRAMSPRKVGQKFLQDWCGAQGFGAYLPVEMAADLVDRITAVVEAERSR